MSPLSLLPLPPRLPDADGGSGAAAAAAGLSDRVEAALVVAAGEPAAGPPAYLVGSA